MEGNAGNNARKCKENVIGVVVMDIAVEKVGMETDAMVLLVEKPNMFVFFRPVQYLVLVVALIKIAGPGPI